MLSIFMNQSMVTKIDRKDCLLQYSIFPQNNYDIEKDEEYFFYPNILKSYTLSLPSKSTRGNSTLLGQEITKIIRELGQEKLIFLGDNNLPWVSEYNDYNPVLKAEQYLKNHKLDNIFNGALEVDIIELPTFIKHLSWLSICNAAFPHIYFIDELQNIIGHICKYGNLHLDIVNESNQLNLKAIIEKGKFDFIEDNNCYNKFGETKAIKGRRRIV